MKRKVKEGNKLKTYVFLHGVLLIYSFTMVGSKLASSYPLKSLPFLLSYGLVLGVLFVYALLWQQVLKRLPLTMAYGNKAVTVIWGLVWGRFLFGERINGFQIAGSIVIIIGIAMMAGEAE